MAARGTRSLRPLTDSSCGMPLRAADEPPPGRIERGRRVVVGRHVPDLLAGELLQPEIGAGRELMHLHVPLDHGDERQEQRAVESIAVQVAGRDVRGRDHHDAELEQPREQAAEDHGVGNVGDVELVEAEQPALLGDLGGGKPDRIVGGDLAEFQLLPEHAHALVHVAHELVEMRAALADHRACFEAQVHQHGLAAADVAEHVKALGGLLIGALAEQPADRMRAARRAMRGDALLQRLEPHQQTLLRRVALDLFGGGESFRKVRGPTFVVQIAFPQR